MTYAVSEGEGAFYGPKIDLHMGDSLGRSWQMGTIQLDFQMPARFGLTYVGSDNHEHVPVVIHRAILGALERFLGIYIEHVGGEFPLWLAPVQVAVVPVGEAAEGAALDVLQALRRAGVVAEIAYKGNLKRRMERANRIGARAAVILGEDELARGVAQFRDLDAGTQETVAIAEIPGKVK